MPNRWPISSGNWSNSAIWSGSLIPTASDVVYANGQTVNIDTNVSFTTLRHDASASAVVAGGYFIPNNGVTMTGNILGAYGTGAITEHVLRCTGSNSSTLIGNISTSGNNFMVAVSMANGSSLTVTGSVQCSPITVGGGTTNRAILMASTGSLVITGSVLSGGNGNSLGTIHATAAGTIRIIGNVTSLVGALPGPVILVQGNPNITIQGDVVSGVSTAINVNTGTSTLTITGSVYQSPSATATSQILVAGTSCNINISGSIFAGPAAPGISCTITGNSTLRGPIYASILYPGISFTTATTHIVNATGPFYNVNNRNAVFAPNIQLLSGSTTTWTFDTETALEQRTLYTADYPGNFPSASNVRQGTVFGNTGQFTGIVVIPVASNVLKGVPIGNTTGSASFNTQNVWSVLTSSLNATGSIGERLRSASTVAIDANLITLTGSL
jgi:hypothetical protein